MRFEGYKSWLVIHGTSSIPRWRRLQHSFRDGGTLGWLGVCHLLLARSTIPQVKQHLGYLFRRKIVDCGVDVVWYAKGRGGMDGDAPVHKDVQGLLWPRCTL
jgi:hypothetical protein